MGRTTQRELDRAARESVTIQVRCVMGEWQLWHGCELFTIHVSGHPTKKAAEQAEVEYRKSLASQPIRWRRKQRGIYDSACGRFKLWLGGDEAWYAEADGKMSPGFPWKKSAQQWCERNR